ncbi:MAG: EamA family transporter [Planctomycetota bacterium]|nr:EamA family transporter [Planctomycetota bacterium]
MSALPDGAAVGRSRSTTVVAFVALYIFWGSTYLGSKFAMASFPPALLSGIRFTIAGLAMAGILLASGKLHLKDFANWRWWRNCGLAGVLLFAMANVMVSMGVQRIPSGVAALIVALTSVWIVSLDRMISRAGAPSWTIVLGLGCGVAGVTVLGGPSWGGGASELNTAGVLLAAGSTLAWAAGTMVAKHSARPDSLWAASVMQMLGGGAAALVVSTVFERSAWPAWEAVAPSSLWAIVYLVVFGSLVGFSAYVWLLSNVNAAAVATYAYVNPLVALCLGTLIVGEAIPARTALAAPLILGSVALMQFVRPPSKDEPPVAEE